MQAKFGIRFILLVLLVVFVGVPMVKIAAGKSDYIPDWAKSWFMSV